MAQQVSIDTYTGQERHSANGAKGYVFIFDPATKKESFLGESNIANLTDKRKGWSQEGHGKWDDETWNVPDGTILKLYAQSTHHGIPDGGGSAYFRVKAELPRVEASGVGYGARAGTIIGPIEMIPYEKISEELGVEIPARLKRYYRDHRIEVKLVEEAKQE